MPPLPSPDSHFLSAAEGWLALGVPAEAERELDLIGREFIEHPDYLEVWWHILAVRCDWMTAVPIARKLLQAAPDRASGWLHLAYAIRRASDDGLNAAWDVLLPAHDKFPKEPTIAYNLACYACQLQKHEDALKWMRIAIRHGGRKNMVSMALADEDLQPLWTEIGLL